MSATLVGRVTRKAVVIGATVAVLGIGLVSVQLATQWRAAAAPLDTNPVSATSISDAMAAQQQRAQILAGQIDQVGVQVTDIRSALQAANGAMADQNGNAADVQAQLKGAQSKLATLQSQLKAAQKRLAQLNAAAARQAALNAAAKKRVVTVTTSRGGGGGGGEHEGGDDD